MSHQEAGVQPALRFCRIEQKSDTDKLGFNLNKSKWEPYPRVYQVVPKSASEEAGLRDGDCLLAVNGKSVVGSKMSQVTALIRSSSSRLELLVWTLGEIQDSDCEGPNLKLSSCLESLVSLLECPVCLETISPPANQCLQGHLLCRRCRSCQQRCPICRGAFSRTRPLLAHHLYTSLTDVLLSRPPLPFIGSALVPVSSTPSSTLSSLPGKALAAFICLPQSLNIPLAKCVLPPNVPQPDITSPEPMVFSCPIANCNTTTSTNYFLDHFSEYHSSTLLVSKLSVDIPMSPGLVMPPVCLMASQKVFVLKTVSSSDGVFVWLWMVGNAEEEEQWEGKLSLHQGRVTWTLTLGVFSVYSDEVHVRNSPRCTLMNHRLLEDLIRVQNVDSIIQMDVEVYAKVTDVALLPLVTRF